MTKVNNLELFFDLVFVYTITHLTNLLAHPHGPLSYLQAVLVFLSLMWIYDGFIWLSSNFNYQSELDKWLDFAGMLGFFIMALGIPTITGAGGVTFGLGLIFVTLIHFFLFSRVLTSSAQAIFSVAPYNLASALLVLYSAFVGGVWHWALWLLAIAITVLAVLRRSEVGFSFSPRQFAERHGLLIIIVLGESIMALGTGAQGLSITFKLVGAVSLGLVLAAHLWWSYFGPDNERAEHALLRVTPRRRSTLALHGYGSAHMVMFFGVIMVAAAFEVMIHHLSAPTPLATAWNFAVGLALFYLGNTLFYAVMRLGIRWSRLALALLALCSVPAGLRLSALAQLVICLLLVALVTLFEDYVLEPRREALELQEAHAG